MVRHRPAVAVTRSPLLSRAGLLAVLVSSLLMGAACGSSKDSTKITSITGTFDVSAIDCGGLAAGVPAALTVRIASGRTYSFIFSGDGSTVALAMVDPSCTWGGGQYNVTYPSDTRFSIAGFGSFTCTPSAAACAWVLAVEVPSNPNLCGTAIIESGTFDHGTVPPSAGGTMTLSFVGDTTCSNNGGANPLRYVLTRR